MLARRGLNAPVTIDALVDALSLAVFVVDSADVVIDANAAAETLSNLSREQLRGRALPPLLSLEDPVVHRCRDVALALFDVPLMTASMPVRVDVRFDPLADPAGGQVVVVQPLPRQQLGADKVGRTAVGAASMLAHEIKNPLAAIRGAAQLLDAGLPASSLRLTRLIRSEVDRVKGLLDNLDRFGDERPLAREAVNVHDVLEHVRSVITASKGNAVSVADRYDPSLPSALANRDSLVQVVLNLVTNAIEASPPGGTVWLATRFCHGVARATLGGSIALPIEIAVIDEGHGPLPEIADQLFQPFVSTKASSRGLGLALAAKLVRDNDGLIQFERQPAQSRTVFRVLLPVAR